MTYLSSVRALQQLWMVVVAVFYVGSNRRADDFGVMLWINACRLIELTAFTALTRMTASVSSFEMICLIAWTAVSLPAVHLDLEGALHNVILYWFSTLLLTSWLHYWYGSSVKRRLCFAFSVLYSTLPPFVI